MAVLRCQANPWWSVALACSCLVRTGLVRAPSPYLPVPAHLLSCLVNWALSRCKTSSFAFGQQSFQSSFSKGMRMFSCLSLYEDLNCGAWTACPVCVQTCFTYLLWTLFRPCYVYQPCSNRLRRTIEFLGGLVSPALLEPVQTPKYTTEWESLCLCGDPSSPLLWCVPKNNKNITLCESLMSAE